MSWRQETLKYLRGMLEGCRSVIAAQDTNVTGLELLGVQEWTVPWGMDDGVVVVRLAIVRDAETAGYARPVWGRVVVAAAARGFGQAGAEVGLPRFTDDLSPARGFADLREQDRSLTKSLALELLEGAGGEAASLREEAGGALSFTVLLAGR
ncbi:hypothetical protein GTU99_26015 [Streptomyces sp. PRKS01-65]|nr:hypothetical protein [Streptomyces harenosi]NEY35580.1 hypothetical protein [Streptomyces harenosi]